MSILKNLIKYINQHYWIFLVLIVFISYGQQLNMYVWKDDNAIFFKFNHLNEMAGYLGRGLFGEGTYKFSITPYWFIYKLVGYNIIWPYYLLTLIFYYLSTISIYKLFSSIFSSRNGKIAGFLFACGYIGSEGFLWLASSMIINVSIILTCFTLINFIQYQKNKSVFSYLLSLFFYFLSSFITPVRTHYLFLVLIVGIITYANNRFVVRRWVNSILLFIPFSLIFYKFFILEADQRTFSAFEFLKGLFAGKYYYLYSFFSSIGNVIFPDREFLYLSNVINQLHLSHYGFYFVALGIAGTLNLLFFFINRFKWSLVLSIISFVIDLTWLFVSLNIASSPNLSQFSGSFLPFYLGGIFCFFIIYLSLIYKDLRNNIMFLGLWFAISIFVYTSYLPDVVYASFDRYLAHSFIPLVGILSILSVIQFKKISHKLLLILIITWGIVNMFNSITYQHSILLNRSYPAKSFYSQLKAELSEINKGDLIFFDVSNQDKEQFNAAFSVGQMPDSTAIAWRYGIDRYDFQMFTDYPTFTKAIINNANFDSIYSFIYKNGKLINTTQKTRNALLRDSGLSVNYSSKTGISNPKQLAVDFDIPIESVTDNLLSLDMKLDSDDVRSLVLPYGEAATVSQIYKNSDQRQKAFEYLKFKKLFFKETKYKASSNWQDRVVDNIHDQNIDTVWQPDRVLWNQSKEYIEMDFNKVLNVSSLVWINGFSNNTPTEYEIEVSISGTDWQPLKTISSVKKIDTKAIQEVDIGSVDAKKIRVIFKHSLNEDSPGIAEMWVIPSEFKSLDINEVENFLQNPYLYIPSKDDYLNTLKLMESTGKVSVWWYSEENNKWVNSPSTTFEGIYNGKKLSYNITIPQGGLSIRKIKILLDQIPGKITLYQIESKPISLKEIK